MRIICPKCGKVRDIDKSMRGLDTLCLSCFERISVPGDFGDSFREIMQQRLPVEVSSNNSVAEPDRGSKNESQTSVNPADLADTDHCHETITPSSGTSTVADDYTPADQHPNTNNTKHIEILRPALIAAIIGFGWGISWSNRSPGMDYGSGYLFSSMMIGIVFSFLVFALTALWQWIRKMIKGSNSIQPDLDKIPTHISEDSVRQAACQSIRINGWTIAVIYSALLIVRLTANVAGLFILDAFAVLGLLACVMRKRNIICAWSLFILFAISAVATGYNRFYGGFGGANLFMALMLLWLSMRIIGAINTLKRLSNKNSVEILSPISTRHNVIKSAISNPQEQRLADLHKLFKKGLITKPVYEKRQSEILREE